VSNDYLDQVKWNADGLVAAIAQDCHSKRVLMMAWMNREALKLTVEGKVAVYWSRSRQKLWRKGESSGNTQSVKAVKLDCDGDAIILDVEQAGGIACHTGRESCFYRELIGGEWQTIDDIIKDPKEIYL